MNSHHTKKTARKSPSASHCSVSAKALKKAGQEFRSEAYLSAIIENQPGMVWLKDKAGRFLAVNRAFAKACGMKTPERVMGKTDLDVWPKEFAKKYRVDDKKVMRTGRSLTVEEPISDEGVSKWCETFKTPVLNEDGRVIGTSGYARDITERKQAEEELRQSLSLQRATLESTADGILVVDKSGKIADFNERFLKLWRLPRKILVSRDDEEVLKFVLIQLKDPKGFLHKVQQLYGHPEKDSFDVLEFKDGRIVERYSHPQVVNGKPVGRVWSFRDVTERKQAEAALRSSEERFRRFAVASSYGFAMGELTGQLIFGNAATLRIVEEKREEDFTRKTFYQYYRPQDAKRLKKEILPIVIKRGQWVGELPLLSAKGNLTLTEQNIFLIRNEQGEPRMVGNIITDITDRKRAENSLREHRRQLLQIIDTVPHMIFAKDKIGRFLLVNRATAEAYQKEPKDLIGVRREDIHQDRQEAKRFLKGDREVLASGKPTLISNELFTDVQGCKHILQTIKIPFRMTGIKETCILGVSVDVTEQRKVEEFRNDIVRTVSHELRTPLSIEKEGISLLMDEMMGPINAEQKKLLGTVMRSVDRLARMITSLLDISSIEAGKIKLLQKMTDLTNLVKDVAFEFKKRIGEKGIDLSVKLPGRAVQALADPDKIAQVLTNLVDNAFKFTAKGVIEISLVVLKDEVECRVRDTGIGIAPENADKIFEKFQQFSRTIGPGEKGLGLGLPIAKAIVDLHGGRIWAQSELGKGTRVTFTLPFLPKKGAP